ncbi:MAG: ankyrin repeat domain-containing protein [Sedimentisphaerales bacterium]|nr:ankyrin repeat domain-containing protein [Sedimentisphaerales bacterium]
MRSILSVHFILGFVPIIIVSPCFSAEPNAPIEDSKYLQAVREFADNVLKYGRDTYGPKHTPLFVDGLNVYTHEPVKWISPNRDVFSATEIEEWVLSNFGSQQTLLRTLNGLSAVTGDPKYREAATQAIKYAFDNLRTPSGMFYWGHKAAYDVRGDKVYSYGKQHEIKLHYPYYELMWQVDPTATKELIDATWSAHVLDWSNLDINRIASFTEHLEEPWNHEYKGGPVFFNSKSPLAHGFFNVGTSLAYSGAELHILSGQEQPLVWSKRLIHRFVDTRNPNTGISAYQYNKPQRRFVGGSVAKHFNDPRTGVFPFHPFEAKRKMNLTYFGENMEPLQWISMLLTGDMLGEQGKELALWSLEELTAWGKASYRERDNSFVPILTDGTNIEGFVLEESCPLGLKGDIAKALFAGPEYFWSYAIGYRVTGDVFMWQMVRCIARGNGFGDIGAVPGQTPALNVDTTNSDAYSLLAFLELYNRTTLKEFLAMARRLADNIVAKKFNKGLFTLSQEHIYARFDCFEPLTLLHLVAALESQQELAPQVWPSCTVFTPPYRYKHDGCDRTMIYALTKSPEVSWSLQEAAAVGDLDLVKSLIEDDSEVDKEEDSSGYTALHRAVMGGHKEVVEYLIAKGACIDYIAGGNTPLSRAVYKGHIEIVRLLLDHGADVNVKNNWEDSKPPLEIAVERGQKEIVSLLVESGAGSTSIQTAAYLGLQEQVKKFLDQGIEINVKDGRGNTPLLYAAMGGHEQLVRFLIEQGASINEKGANGNTALYHAVQSGNSSVITFLLDNGAEASFFIKMRANMIRAAEEQKTKDKETGISVHVAAQNGDQEKVKALLGQGADINAKDSEGNTILHYAIKGRHSDLIQFLIAQGVDVNVRGKDGRTALNLVAADNDISSVKLLLSAGADVSLVPGGSPPALFFAVLKNNIDMVKLLVEKGARPDSKVTDDMTVFQYAVSTRKRDIVELLTKAAEAQEKE